MRKKLIGVLAIASLILAPLVFAAVDVQVDGVSLGEATHINFEGDVSGSTDGSTMTIEVPATTAEKSIMFLPGDFISWQDYPGGTTVVTLSASSVPVLQIDNNSMAIVWVDTVTSPVQVIFKVPADYSSGGSFRAFVDESDSTTPNQVDFSVNVNSDSSVSGWHGTISDQVPVALTVDAGTPEQITLTVDTDFATLAAGQWVTLNIWRDDVADGTGDLELYYLEFIYNASE